MNNKRTVLQIAAISVYIISQILILITMFISINNNIINHTDSFILNMIKTWGICFFILIVFIILCMIISDVVLIYYNYTCSKNHELEYEIEMNEKILKENIKYYNHLEDEAVKIRKIKHDFNNILFTAELLSTDSTGKEDALRILDQAKEKLDQTLIGGKEIV